MAGRVRQMAVKNISFAIETTRYFMANYQLLKILLSIVVTFSKQFLALANSCVHGSWEEDVCVCNSGYETVFHGDTTEPNYCTEQIIVVIVLKGEKTWTHRDVLDLALPIIAVYILGFSVIATVATLYKAGGLCWSKENLRKIMNEDAKFSDMERRYKNVKMKDAMIWELPLEHYHVMNATIEADQDVLYKHAKVIHDYKAQNEEELNIREGDVIMDVIELENGWWQGNLNGVIGYFPGEYVEFIENKNKSGAVSDASLISETSSFYLKQRFGTYDTWRGYDKKGKVKKGDYQQLKAEDKEHDDANKIEAIPGSPMLEKSDATQPKKKTKKHSKKKYTEIDNLSSIENLTESKFFGDENSEGSDTKKEQRKRKKKSKYDKEQTSPKADEESKKHRKRRKKHTESHSDEQQSIESETALLSSEISTEKEAKKKKGHKGSEGSRDKKSKKRKRKHKEHSGEQPITEKSASILESASGETLRKRNKQKGKKDEGLSDDELFLAGADSPLMSLTDVSSGEDKKPPTKGIFRRLFKW